MPFIGNQPALSYTSFAKQDFTTSATTSYTLDNPVANANELALFINFVRQEPTTAYSASGTSLTLTSATSATDDMYCVFLGKAVQTVNPPNGSVGTAQIADLAVTSGKLASGVLPTNTPAFRAYTNTAQTTSAGVTTKAALNLETYDTDNCYDTSTYRFTPNVAGTYVFNFLATDNYTTTPANDFTIRIRKNGSDIADYQNDTKGSNYGSNIVSTTVEMNGTTDYVEFYLYYAGGSGVLWRNSSARQYAEGYRLIT
jgi:hypothetical protein